MVTAEDWTRARKKLGKAIRRGDRDRYDRMVLGLLALATRGQPAGPQDAEHRRGLLRVGVATATALARHAADDLDLLAVAATLPWFDETLLGSRSPVLSGPPEATRFLLLALAPPGARSMREAASGDRSGYLRQLAALPPLPRAAALLTRYHAAGVPEVARLAFAAARPFDAAELAVLAAGLPADLLPPPGPPGPPPGPPTPPVGSAAEAVSLVRSDEQTFGGYRLLPDGDPGYLVDGQELVYRVRWDAPADAVRSVAPPVAYPGDPEPIRYREPGWIVDRVTREVHPVDLALGEPAGYVGPRRAYPLPPAALDLPPAIAAEATERYRARLTGPDWPDFLVAYRIGDRTVRALMAAGRTEPDVLLAALLLARGPAAGDTLVDPGAPAWATPAGDLARAADPGPVDPDGAAAAERAARLADAAPEVRALAVANAQARALVETELFGTRPLARDQELLALGPLAPAFIG